MATTMLFVGLQSSHCRRSASPLIATVTQTKTFAPFIRNRNLKNTKNNNSNTNKEKKKHKFPFFFLLFVVHIICSSLRSPSSWHCGSGHYHHHVVRRPHCELLQHQAKGHRGPTTTRLHVANTTTTNLNKSATTSSSSSPKTKTKTINSNSSLQASPISLNPTTPSPPAPTTTTTRSIPSRATSSSARASCSISLNPCSYVPNLHSIGS